MRAVGIGDHNLHAFQRQRNQLKFKGIAIQINRMPFLSHGGGKLIHDAAHNPGKFMLGFLRHLYQFNF
ncbi:hypothetical protein DSECCO2_660080 [anaerobic digester metagenome]